MATLSVPEERQSESLRCGKGSRNQHVNADDNDQWMQNCVTNYWESHRCIRAWLARVESDQETLEFTQRWYQYTVPSQLQWMTEHTQRWREEALIRQHEATFCPQSHYELAPTFYNSNVEIPLPTSRKRRSKHLRKSSRSSRRKHRRLRNNSTGSAVAKTSVTEDAEKYGDDESDGVEFEFEMSDELLQFFKQTAEHRKERAQVKAALQSTEKDEGPYLDLEAACSGRGRATVLPPNEQKSALRNVEMRQLYGAGAAMIQGMETAMQLTFDRNTDKHKPRPWPALPLNIRFDDAKDDGDEVSCD